MRAERRKSRAFDQAVAASRALVNVTVLRAQAHLLRPTALAVSPIRPTSARPPLSSSAKNSTNFMIEVEYLRPLSVDIPAPRDTKVRQERHRHFARLRSSAFQNRRSFHRPLRSHRHARHRRPNGNARARRFARPHLQRRQRRWQRHRFRASKSPTLLPKFQPHPKRSIVFMTFFGEERGELGSQFYGKHPVFPICQTVADLNLEQVGRTDSTVGRN